MKHPDILNLLDDMLEQKIRNVKIRTTWEVMKDWTSVRYTKRIELLMERYHLSYSHIETIIRQEED